ncbi:phosphatidylserine decarboxylase family protein [Anaplasma phagocytophilum str. ApNP]|uniref:Phosphatidylserine decarboxylase family protein n=1 Tax=Anaplasma phagocytophilum str. ApNP TaxID=1359153 RepID=A0A0F3NF64_ANAPH|nr:phosphatidylserine decarboxylase family protein [Anaplasma phagocytophilum str. ApNP]
MIISPADGLVTSVAEVESPIEAGKMVTRVSVFLSILNVHVNRAPVSGSVKLVEHRPGRFLLHVQMALQVRMKELGQS